jgi:amino acid adenylation domain-containing protein
MKNLFKRLREHNIRVSLNGVDLQVNADSAAIPQDLLDELRKNKPEIISYLKNNVFRETGIRRVKARSAGEGYALSSSQRRLWVLSQFPEGNIAYNMAESYLFEGELNREALAYAFDAVLERHEILRTVFREDEEGEVRQHVLDVRELGFRVHYEDLRASGAAEARAGDLSAALIQTPFDLSVGPLLRVSLYQTGDHRWVFTYIMHHIISDGWSMDILFRELLLLYRERLSGVSAGLPELAVQYKDYAGWQQEQLSGGELAADRSYWLSQLGGELPLLDLAGDRPRPVVKTYHGGSVSGRIGVTQTGALKRLLLQEGCTLFMGLLAGLKGLLYRYTGQEDILIGSPVAGRDHGELEGQIGLYLNTLVLRSRFSGSQSYRELLSHVREVTVSAFKHQQYPFDELVNELQLQRDTSRNALFDVMLILHNNAQLQAPAAGIEGLRLSRYAAGDGPGVSKFDLTFGFIEHAGGWLEVTLEYNSDIYDAATAARLLQHLEQLLCAAVASPETALQELDYLDAGERHTLLKVFNASGYDYPRDKTVVDLFEAQVQCSPLSEAVSDAWGSYSYQEVWDYADRMSRHLQGLPGGDAGGPVAVLLKRSGRMLISLLGVLKSGRAYIPLDASYPVERLNYILSGSGSGLLISDEELPAGLVTEGLHICTVDELLEDKGGAGASLAVADGAAYIIYTSGSTGRPKGIEIGHRSVVNFLTSMQSCPGLDASDLMFAVTTYSFDISVLELLLPLISGGRVYIADSATLSDPAAVISRLASVRPTVLQATPGFYQQLFDSGWSGDKGLKVLCGGDVLSEGLALRLLHSSREVWNMYGPTETTVWSCVKQVRHPGDATNIGRPINNTDICILDGRRGLLPAGVAGNIYIGGEGLAHGYYRNAELTRERFIPHPFRAGQLLYDTGDVGKWTVSGEIIFLGRSDHQVKVRGYRIELGEIEQQLADHEQIAESVVVARGGSGGDKELVAYIRSHTPLSVGELRSYLSRRLPVYMLPAHYVALEVFPLTPNGKIDRKRLPSPGGEGLPIGREYIAPRNETEEQLIRIWQEILGREKIGIEDNFFELGGHSLKLTRLASRLYKQFDVKPDMNELFTRVMLKEQAAWIQSARKIAYAPIKPAAVQSSYVLSSSQRRLWVLSQFPEGNIAYNMAESYLFEGELNREALAYAFDAVLERHEILRTVFREDEEGEVRQHVLDVRELGFRVHYEDLRASGAAEARAGDLSAALIQTPFDLSVGPLLRVSLYQTGDHRWVFTYIMHHIISDGWSMDILFRELLLLYRERLSGVSAGLPELAVQYKDYAGWQQEQLSGGELAADRSYWLSQLGGELPLLDLAGDRPRPVVKTYHGGSVSGRIGVTQTGALKRLLLQEGCTLFMGLLAGLKGLLYRYTGQEDILIGSPVAGRDHGELEGQIGLYLNTLVLRSRFSGSQSYRELLSHVREVTVSAFKHQQYPFDELVNELQLQRDTSRNALFDVMLILHNNAQLQAPAAGIEGLRLSRYAAGDGPGVSKFDLTFGFIEHAGGWLEVTLEYNSDIYDAATAARLLQHLEQLLCAAVASPETALQELDYLDAGERHTLLKVFNASGYDYPRDKTVVDLFEAQVQCSPLSEAVSDAWGSYSYQEVWDYADRMSRHLQGLPGGDAGGPVAVLLKRSGRMLISLLGVLKSGRAYIPLDASYPVERLNYILSGSGSGLLISDEELPAGLVTEGLHICTVDELLEDKGGAGASLAVADGAAYIIYTSGSTGRPKGIEIGHRSVVNFLTSMQSCPGLDASDLMFAVTTYSFDISVLELLLPLISGGRVYIADSATLSDPAAVISRLASVRPTVLQATPGFYQQLFDSGWSGDKGLKVLCGGDVLSEGLALRLLHSSREVWNMYGPTETTVWSCVKQVRHPGDATNIGRPINNTDICILDGRRGLLPAGVAGNIYIGGEGLAHGYYRNAELTRERFIPHPFRAGQLLYDTGDVGKWTVSGEIIFLGRSDHQVKVRGYRIELGEIEQQLADHEQIAESVVVARGGSGGDKELVAYIRSHTPLSVGELRSYLSRRLPVYMLPAHYVALEVFPLTPNGKIDRKRLPSPGGEGLPIGREYIAPRNETEEQLIRIWQEILGREKIGIEDNFFELGGNSMKIIKLSKMASRLLGADISVPLLFQYSSIQELTDYINQEPVAQEETFDRDELISDLNRFNFDHYEN